MPQFELVKQFDLAEAKLQLFNRTEEYYHSIRANIQFSGADLKVITITSAQPNEGKSTTATGLALSFAKSGFRTLLIDADTRHSVLSGTFKANGSYQGLTNFLAGNAELSEIICDTSIDNLMIIPSGPFPPNPASLLQSKTFKSMIEKVRGLYDYVLIDTPPLGVVIDAAIVSHFSDANLMVVKSGLDKRRTVMRLKEQLEQTGSVFLGVILNKHDVGMEQYGSYGSYGNYGNQGNSRTNRK